MATLEEMERALIAADRAGNVEDARRLAAAIRSQRQAQPQGQQRGQGFFTAMPQGFNSGLATVAGLPVDAANALLSGVDRVAGTQLSGDMPVGGSRWLRKAMRGFDRVPALSQVTYDQMQDLAPSDRKWAVAGEVMGGAMPFAAAPLAIARAGATGPAFLRSAVEAARANPGRFASTEAGLAAGAAQGGAIAEVAAPGSEMARLAGETIGGFVNPTQAWRAAAGAGLSALNAVETNFSRAGRERAAARVLQDTLRRTGEDPAELAAALRQQDPFRLGLTAGQETGSTGLLAVERRIADLDPQFAARMESRPGEAFANLREAGESVVRTGQPGQLTEAMRGRVGETQSNIAGRRQAAQAQALRGRQAIGDVTPAQQADASIAAREVLGDALGAARGQESALWQQVPRDATVTPTNLLAAREEIRGRLLPNENMRSPVEDYTAGLAERAAEGPVGVTSGELLRLRSRALELGREATAEGRFGVANQMNTMAEGALQDLGGLSNTARDFSRGMNQRFTQGFAGDALARDRTGGPRIEPELTLQRAFGQGGAAGDVRMRQLSEAASFPGETAVGGRFTDLRGQEMLNQQDRFLRGAVQSVIDPATGRVNPNRLAAWQRDNASILERFPQLKRDLGSAEAAQRTLNRVEAITDKATRNAGKTVIARIAGVDDATVGVGRLLSVVNANRVGEYASLARAAQNAGPEAVAGLRSATLESVFKNSTNATGQFDFERLSQLLLNKGPSDRDQSVLEMMRGNGVLDEAASQRLQAIINRANRLTTALRKPAGTGQLVDDPDALTDFLTTVVGARAGATVGGGTGASLKAAAAGSSVMRKWFQKLPANKTQEVLAEAAMNPKFMAMLLEKPTTAQQARVLSKQINAFLFSAGISAASNEMNERRPLEESLDAFAQ